MAALNLHIEWNKLWYFNKFISYMAVLVTQNFIYCNST